MDRESALRVLAEDVLSPRDYGRDRDLVSDFVRGMFRQDWQALQEKLNGPLTEAQVTHVTKKTLGVMCDLVLSLVPTILSQQQPMAQCSSVHKLKSVRFASPKQCDAEFLEESTEEVMRIIMSSYDLNQASMEQETREGGKILEALTSRVNYHMKVTDTDLASTAVSESHFTHDPDEDCCTFFDRSFWLCSHKIKGQFRKNTKPSLTVDPRKVTTELSNEEFQASCRDELKEFLQRNQIRFLHDSDAPVSQEKLTAVASELLDSVMSSAHQLCEPSTARNIRVSEDKLNETAYDLKDSLKATLQRFFSQIEFFTESCSKDKLVRSLDDLDDYEVISKWQLKLFVKLLINKALTVFLPRDLARIKEKMGGELPTDTNSYEEWVKKYPLRETHAFVTEALTVLIKTFRFPPPDSGSVNGTRKALLADDGVNSSVVTAVAEQEEPEPLEELFSRLQRLQPELF